jgi:hypothetical protein
MTTTFAPVYAAVRGQSTWIVDEIESPMLRRHEVTAVFVECHMILLVDLRFLRPKDRTRRLPPEWCLRGRLQGASSMPFKAKTTANGSNFLSHNYI